VNTGIAGGIVAGEEVEELGLAAAVVEDNIILLFTGNIPFCFKSGVLKAIPLKTENARTDDDVIITVNTIDNRSKQHQARNSSSKDHTKHHPQTI
jgi:hypothetical protein